MKIYNAENKVYMVIIAYIAYCIQQITKTYTTFEGM